ncbi:MAG TPA: isocitrate lyase/phosphoenolpyruvate mutase family protein [Dokdonella sp.]|uniref:isocitrate lyase/PEP mutase family protein n=1 Tax=Dokdonella sp. TaxID=2291710 RepID=UPI002C66DA58|nr:isocitrate lyase/phosphoenolpyruvate mutase family protein [Dokdonella sp.]HOX72043.1 isocitrate lyase/phosphoenolpyruvate mutase family protein [Dokdonella sp.]HPG93516.1 isocitrate lyase/phosphoenolpyruvate mutase family protein [Dokdonella sp.]HPN78415.1 isocitrate lyase/phosphoenolpyruvate mutase family protein [Dokdonella sp.]
MSDQNLFAEQFRLLHVRGKPLVLFNAWDAGSARAVAAGGAKAIALGSWSVAAAHGYEDGERVPFDFVIDNLKRIVGSVELPVSIDLESGYGETPADVGRSVARVIEAGAIGCNLEDSFPQDGSLREPADGARRIARARVAAESAGIPFFINARTDDFMQTPRANHDLALLRASLERGRAYADAGADGLFIPGLVDPGLIERAAKESPLPLNIMKSAPAPTFEQLAALGVARISHGPGPYRTAMSNLTEACRAIYAA